MKAEKYLLIRESVFERMKAEARHVRKLGLKQRAVGMMIVLDTIKAETAKVHGKGDDDGS